MEAAGFTHTFAQLVTAGVIAGAGAAIIIPATYRRIRLNFPESKSGFAVGI